MPFKGDSRGKERWSEPVASRFDRNSALAEQVYGQQEQPERHPRVRKERVVDNSGLRPTTPRTDVLAEKHRQQTYSGHKKPALRVGFRRILPKFPAWMKRRNRAEIAQMMADELPLEARFGDVRLYVFKRRTLKIGAYAWVCIAYWRKKFLCRGEGMHPAVAARKALVMPRWVWHDGQWHGLDRAYSSLLLFGIGTNPAVPTDGDVVEKLSITHLKGAYWAWETPQAPMQGAPALVDGDNPALGASFKVRASAPNVASAPRFAPMRRSASLNNDARGVSLADEPIHPKATSVITTIAVKREKVVVEPSYDAFYEGAAIPFTYELGSIPVYPTPPQIEGLRFNGWRTNYSSLDEGFVPLSIVPIYEKK